MSLSRESDITSSEPGALSDLGNGQPLASTVDEAIRRGRLVPVLRCASALEAISLADRILDHGHGLIEIAATTPDWLNVVGHLRKAYPGVVLGVGTIRTLSHAQRAKDEGADFLVSPYPSAELRENVGSSLIEGGFTPGEVARAGSYGLAKLFPAHVGGTMYLRSLIAVLPDVAIMPTGGINLAQVGDWFKAGASAVGVGSGWAELADPATAIREALDGYDE